jgi:glycosyltransferase involved in cell wall biosynthesis
LPKLRGSKIILDIHDIVPEYYVEKFKVSKESYIYKALVWIEKISIGFSDHVIISNHLWEDKLISRSVDKQKCTTIMNYPDTNIFYKRPNKRDTNKFIIIYPGSLSWHQGLDIAIKAFAIIKDQTPEVEFHIYGEGNTRDSLIDLVSQLGLDGRVLFKESLPIDKIADVMSKSDIGVVPKRANGFGNDAFSTKILEFMSVGVPIIISRTRIDQFYFDESLVTFFESDNEKDLADKMLLLIKDKNLRETQIANSLKYIEENNWSVKKSLYINIVNSQLG